MARLHGETVRARDKFLGPPADSHHAAVPIERNDRAQVTGEIGRADSEPERALHMLKEQPVERSQLFRRRANFGRRME